MKGRISRSILICLLFLVIFLLTAGLSACSPGTESGPVETQDDASGEVDVAELEQAILAAEELQETDFNHDAWQEFWQVYIYATDIYDRAEYTQESVDDAAESLDAAIAELTSPDSTDEPAALDRTGKNRKIIVLVVIILCAGAAVTAAAVGTKRKHER